MEKQPVNKIQTILHLHRILNDFLFICSNSQPWMGLTEGILPMAMWHHWLSNLQVTDKANSRMCAFNSRLCDVVRGVVVKLYNSPLEYAFTIVNEY